MATHDAGEPDVIETGDGRYLRWRGSFPAFAVVDLIKFPCRSKVATLTRSLFVDAAAPTVTTFLPENGCKDDFSADSLDGGPAATSALAPSFSQTPVALDLVNLALFIRPVPSAGPITLQYQVTIRVGHRV